MIKCVRNKKIKYLMFSFLSILSLVCCIFIIKAYSKSGNSGFIARRIAHAGGGINGKTYTNSYEALDYNHGRGFLFFELDFVFTHDKKIICLHDWGKNFKSIFGVYAQRRFTLQEFKDFQELIPCYKNCTLDGLAEWMKKNPSTYIITDIKEHNIQALEAILKTLPNAKQRVIPQIYNPHNFTKVKDMGYEQVIWTLYRFGGNNDSVLKWVDTFRGKFAVTMPKERAKSDLPQKLKQRNIPSYVHTINTVEEAKFYMDKCEVTNVYTDFLKTE